ncbi:MAG TPA: hypothetical protein VM802_10990 [Chitinophaga sp.]|uniref:hypothetical protein n=1 Tax=Chitinophaga sp. TaxID=1869181 RepID=UPI002B62F87B|nr:hypothetical protein [Chitinophaga sp.]HVI45391.1 hypothetical protein [Chitinophaga sp.]
MKSYNPMVFQAICLLLLFFSFTAFSQQVNSLTKEQFKAVLNQQFTNLITGQPQSTVGNAAAFDIKDARVSFSGIGIFKNNSILRIAGSAAVTDGFAPIFTNSSLNTKIALDLRYDILARSGNRVTFFADQLDTLQMRQTVISDQFNTDSIRIITGQARNLLHSKITALYCKKDELERSISEEALQLRKEMARYELSEVDKQLTTLADSIDNYRHTAQNMTRLRIKHNELLQRKNSFENTLAESTIKSYVDSVTYEIDIVRYKLNGLNDSLNNFHESKLIVSARNLRNRRMRVLRPNMELYASSMSWFSIGYKVSNNSFRLFDGSLPYTDQVKKMGYISHAVSLQYSSYNWTRENSRSYFWCLGGQFSVTDNFDELSKMDIVEKKNYGPAADDRTSTKTYSAYTGTYEKNLASLNLYGDYYRFLLKDNIIALHGFGNWKIKNNELPIADLGLGLFFSVKDNRDESAVVNMELYYQFTDLFKATETTLKLFERNNIGLRFSFPIKFKTKF